MLPLVAATSQAFFAALFAFPLQRWYCAQCHPCAPQLYSSAFSALPASTCHTRQIYRPAPSLLRNRKAAGLRGYCCRCICPASAPFAMLGQQRVFALIACAPMPRRACAAAIAQYCCLLLPCHCRRCMTSHFAPSVCANLPCQR